jgi:class 3 adenylate cyclase
MTTAAPSGVVTFLFTDVDGSTRRWEADADAMRAALLKHDDVLRTAIKAHEGFLFSHTGDGVVAAFSSPRAAVDAAIDAQRALELPVRMGIATGEGELRDGDYFGTVLNRAARVMAAGHGGQILLADSTAGLLSGVDLVDLGPRRLRDVSTPVGVFQVRAPGLATDFPPLRALDTSPGNLRPAATSFIGRQSEVAEVIEALHQNRLVTLTGVGGVGKTRLATEVASRMAEEFPDGVWFFELAAVADPAAVPDAVAAVLGITQQPGKSVPDSVATALEGRVRLLVFDNCEHLRDAIADLVEAILAQSATVTILATSREGLGVAEEQLWPVPSLDVGAGVDSSAVALFVELIARPSLELGSRRIARHPLGCRAELFTSRRCTNRTGLAYRHARLRAVRWRRHHRRTVRGATHTVDGHYSERHRQCHSVPGSWTDVDPRTVLAASAELGLEGIVCKHLDSTYTPGLRLRDWIKTPHRKRSEFVIGGWLPGARGQPQHCWSPHRRRIHNRRAAAVLRSGRRRN